MRALFAAGVGLTLALATSIAHADSPPPDAATRPPLGKLIFHPEGPGRGRVALSLGVLWDYPPQRVVEGQISAFPMAARVVQRVAQEEDFENFLLMHAMGANAAGQIASVVAGGVLLALMGAGGH